ncbi:MAG: Crp/Fnr family transcriptional regulator [Methanomassiliicoccaceae archaeon]|nr:Crp/Fnr family transcriptional regulator [Methanomassiliicoccaceae archaeon]
MRKEFTAVKDNGLFDGIGYSDFEKMFRCIGAETRAFKRNETVLMTGDAVRTVGLVLSGGVRILREDLDGNSTILGEVNVSEIFGEVLACAGVDHSPVTVRTFEDSEILFIDYRKVISVCPSACEFHSRLVMNLLKLVARKNLILLQKIDILSKRTTREKLMAFFDAHRGAAKRFTINYDRDELARYLCVDRSAMSNELSKMRDEGLLKFNKSTFELL